ncbi:MAG: hypothetical protein DKM22_05645 [Candidatus Melainabacteria bacterium]|nr:MAG: hypothetical protein DKM22_05645 [Candidatus Melainabacteria bacterium]
MEDILSYRAGEDLSEKTIVKFSKEGTVVKATSPADKICGVVLFKADSDGVVDVLRAGRGLVNTAGSISAGDFVTVNKDGKACALDITTLDEGANYILGQAEETSSSAALLQINIHPQLLVIPAKAEETETENNGQV